MLANVITAENVDLSTIDYTLVTSKLTNGTLRKDVTAATGEPVTLQITHTPGKGSDKTVISFQDTETDGTRSDTATVSISITKPTSGLFTNAHMYNMINRALNFMCSSAHAEVDQALSRSLMAGES